MNRRAVLLLAGLAALASGGGCGDAEDGAPALAATCVVQGKLSRFAADGAAPVTFQSVIPGVREFQYTTETGADGHYRAELPAGDYVVHARGGWDDVWYAGGVLVYGQPARPDTVRLSPEVSPLTIDFPLGALRFGGAVPPALVGGTLEFRVCRADTTPQAPFAVNSARLDDVGDSFEVTVPGLLPGSYLAELVWTRDWQHTGERFWLPGARELRQAAFLRVGPDSLTQVAVALPATPARLSGRVGGAWLALGLPTPRITVRDLDGAAIAGSWMVDADGGFALDLLLPEPVTIESRGDGPTQWAGGWRRQDATVFTPAIGQEIAGIDITGGGLRLRAAPSDLTGSGRYASFEFYEPGGVEPVFSLNRRLDHLIGLANLQPGDWQVRVVPRFAERERWRPQWLDRAASADEAALIPVPDGGGILTLDLVLELGGVINGRLVFTQGEDSWRYVLVTPADACVGETSDTVSGDDWDFSLMGLPEGGFRLGVTPAGAWWGGRGDAPPDGTIWYPGTADWNAADILTITGAATIDGVVFTVP